MDARLIDGAARVAPAAAMAAVRSGADGWMHGRTIARSWDHLIPKIRARVAMSPERPATICGDKRLTYAQLWSASAQVAAELVALGVRPGDVVAILVPRGVEFLVAVLGALKARAAYMPLDGRNPPARNAAVVSNTRAAAAVTVDALRDRLPAALPVHSIDRRSAPRGGLADVAAGSYAGDDLAYVINTSGSTGEPKSAGVRHASFANLLDWYVDTLSLDEGDRVLIIGATTFDASQKNFFAPLLTGGAVVFPPDELFDPEAIAAMIKAHRITFVNGTPSNVYPLVEGPGRRDPSLLASLRWAVLGGEPIQAERLAPWLAHPSCGARVLNSYGPTECTDICAAYDFGAEFNAPVVPLGRAIDNVRLAVLDAGGERVVGEGQGELVIAGIGVGVGYLGRPDLTAAAFADDDLPVGRVYRTGDIVRLRADGLLEFVGRKDQQVKLRGFRIELSEVEVALQRLPQIKAAAAVVRADGAGAEPVLVAFLIAADGHPRDAEAVRKGVAATLADYQVPSRFVFQDALPLNSNGKVDRRALAAVALDPAPAGPARPSAATGSLEDQIAAIWGTVLGGRVAHRDTNFFDAGGTSLGIARLQAALGELLGRPVPVVTLFAHPTISRLAAALREADAAPTRATRPLPAGEATRPASRAAALRAVRRPR